MKASQLINRLKHNLAVKVVCFIIAFFIYIFYNISTLDTKVLSIPLEVKQDGEVVLVSMPTHFVRVTVKGKPEDVLQISEQDFFAYLDLNAHYEAGEFSVPVSLDISQQLSLYSPLEYYCKPEQLLLQVDKKNIAYIPVEPSIVGTLPKGYEMDTIRAEPPYISVQGPKQLIATIDKIKTTPVLLDNASGSFTQSVDLLHTNSRIDFDDESVTVHVDLKRILSTRSFSMNIGSYVGLADNLKIEERFPDYSLVLRGFVNDMETFSLSALSVQIDVSDIEKEGEYTLPLALNVPKEFEVVSFEPKHVEIHVKQKQRKSGIEI